MDRSAAEQRAAKAAAIGRALGTDPPEVLPSPRQTHYRARIRLGFAPDGQPGYRRPRSHSVAPIPACAIARPEINRALERLRALLPGPVGLRDIALRSDGERVVYAARSAASARRGGGRRGGGRRGAGRGDPALLEALRPLGDVALDGRRAAGNVRLDLRVAGIHHQIGPSSFYQVNLEANALLVQAVLEAAEEVAPEAVLDLYAGAGNLSLPLAAAGLPVTLIDREGAAIDDARATAERLGLRARFRAQPAERYRPGDLPFDLAVLDPPRAGAPGLIPRLLLTRPRAIIYVSCNPATLGRDIRPALSAGYRIGRLLGFDFFPHTPHVETLAVLLRSR